MLYTIPDYYKEFRCIADKCEDTCCAGWQIVIDKRSLARYRQVKGDLGKRLRRCVRWRDGTFRRAKDRRCTFLNEDNLCDLYCALGEEGLCRTCRLYPRHIEEFEGVREISLSLSCPEAARILLGKKEPVKFLSYTHPGIPQFMSSAGGLRPIGYEKEEEEYEDFDPFLYSMLVDVRAAMIEVLQDRSLSIENRACLVLAIAHDVQGRIERRQIFFCDEVLEKYKRDSARAYVKDSVDAFISDEKRGYTFAKRELTYMYGLELLHESWIRNLAEAEHILYDGGVDTYEKYRREFGEWSALYLPGWDIWREQLLVYFVFTYFCGAVYDGRAYAKAQMSVFSLFVIEELLRACWIRNDKVLDLEDVVDIVYRYSREAEHSDKNLDRLERMMEGDVWTCIERP